uniref:Transposase n=1 Tax=Rhodococcus sp. NS1 TaxID=402236 RepID=A0A097SPV9_9NOCA|nr:hypothetical protein LRS1606.129 [Rhodococcus sp. NS1]
MVTLTLGRKIQDITMTKKMNSDGFKADAVQLYASRLEVSYSSLAADLGVARGSLKTWVHLARKKAAMARSVTEKSVDASETPAEQCARMQAEIEQIRARNQALVVEIDKLSEERDILRKATKYFASIPS